MTLDEVISLKSEMESEFEKPAAGLRLLQNSLDAGLANRFVQSLISRPLRELPMIFDASTPGLVSAALRGRSVTPNLVAAAKALSAQGAEDDTAMPNLTVGYSEVSQHQYRAEVRFQRASVRTVLLAREVARRANGEVRIGEYRDLKSLGDAVVPGPAVDRLPIGSSVGHQKGPAGSLGLFLKSNEGPGIVSNSHVFARCGKARRGDPIYAPHPQDTKDPREIATLRYFSDLVHEDEVPFDAAFALLKDGLPSNANIIPQGMPQSGKRLTETKVLAANLGLEVCKVGRTSKHTTGTLSAVAVSPTIEYPGLGDVKLSGMLEVQWEAPDKEFSKPGDSGSAVYRPDTMEVFGIVVGGGVRIVEGKDEGVSIVCPLDVFMKEWNLSFA